MQLFWDVLRVVTIVVALLTSGVCLSTWALPMRLAQRIQFYALGALVGTIGVVDFIRLGQPPVAASWRLVTDPLIIGAALFGSWRLRRDMAPPTPRRPRSRFESRVGDRKLNAIIAVGYTVIGATLILQPDRYDHTPSYANLLDIFPSWCWGTLYLAVAAGLAVAVRVRYSQAAVVAAYTAASALTATWLAAFLVRWVTDTGTTVVNVTSWSVFLTMIAFSAIAQVDRGACAGACADAGGQMIRGECVPTAPEPGVPKRGQVTDNDPEVT